MTQQRQPRSGRVNLRELKRGERVRLACDVIVEVVENPEDGMWFRGKYISVPNDPSLEGQEDQVFHSDVQEMV